MACWRRRPSGWDLQAEETSDTLSLWTWRHFLGDWKPMVTSLAPHLLIVESHFPPSDIADSLLPLAMGAGPLSSPLWGWGSAPCRRSHHVRDPCFQGRGSEGPLCSVTCGQRLALEVTFHWHSLVSFLAGWSLRGPGSCPRLCPAEAPV